MTRLTQICVQHSRADAALLYTHHESRRIKHDRTPEAAVQRPGLAALARAAAHLVNTSRFLGPEFAAVNDDTMVMGVA